MDYETTEQYFYVDYLCTCLKAVTQRSFEKLVSWHKRALRLYYHKKYIW